MNHNPLDLLGGRPSGWGHSLAPARAAVPAAAASSRSRSHPAQHFGDLSVVLRQALDLLLQILGQRFGPPQLRIGPAGRSGSGSSRSAPARGCAPVPTRRARLSRSAPGQPTGAPDPRAITQRIGPSRATRPAPPRWLGSSPRLRAARPGRTDKASTMGAKPSVAYVRRHPLQNTSHHLPAPGPHLDLGAEEMGLGVSECDLFQLPQSGHFFLQ